MIKRPPSINKRVRTFMVAGYLAIVFLLFVMDWYSISNYQNRIKEKELELVNTTATSINKGIETIDNIIYNIYTNDENFRALSGLLNDVDQYSNSYELQKSLTNSMFLNNDLHGYYVWYGKDKVWYDMDQKYIPESDWPELRDRFMQIITNEKNTGDWITVTKSGNVYISVISKKDNVSVCGIYSLVQIEKEIQSESNGKIDVYVISDNLVLKGKEDAKELGLPENTKVNENEFQYWKNERNIYGEKIKNGDFWICFSIPGSIWSSIGIQQIILLIISLFSVVGAIWVLYFMKNEFVRPLNNLIGTMNEIKRGKWNAIPDPNVRYIEFQEMNETLLTMVGEIEKQKMLSYEETIEKQKAQMQYLQLQLKPHFYLNGLKTLNALAMDGNSEKMQELIMSISSHLRYLLQAEKELLPLEAELNYVKNYFELQKNMTGRNFEYETNIEQELLKDLIPTLCLQTFVENSFKYAKLGNAERVLKITISAQKLVTDEGEFIDLIVKDNGAGYSAELLAEINEPPLEVSKSVGISNLKRRCSLLYGEKAEYLFFNSNGAVSELILPRKENINECTDSG